MVERNEAWVAARGRLDEAIAQLVLGETNESVQATLICVRPRYRGAAMEITLRFCLVRDRQRMAAVWRQVAALNL